MTPKVCFFMQVYQSDYVLEECLLSVRPYGTVVAVEGPVDYYTRQGAIQSTDRTLTILDSYDIPTITGQWKEKDEMATAGEALVPDGTEWVWVLDSDEIWQPSDIERILGILAGGQHDSVAFRAWSFYGGFDRYMTGFEETFEVHRIQRWWPGAHWQTHRPPTVLAPDGRPWRDHRHLAGMTTDAMGIRFFHYSYLWPSQMRAKAGYYGDRDPGGTIPNYFEKVYLPWVLGTDDDKQRVENEFDGVHNWVPQRRGPCRTERYRGKHPKLIVESMPELKRRFDDELSIYRL